jgi:hypothetical protein
VPAGLVQQRLRGCFARWGLPVRVKVDNGSPWGSWSDLPPPLALWLIGLGVEVRWVPARRPQHNGVVEHSHDTAQRWADPGSCDGVEELQSRLDREDAVQREEYPYLAGASRLEAHPGLRHSGRVYREGGEGRLWSWSRVAAHLGGYVVTRKVDNSGKFGLYQGKGHAGARLKGSEVLVQFDPDRSEWLTTDLDGVELCRRPLTQFDPHSLRNLPTTPTQPGERFEAKPTRQERSPN